MAIADYLSKLVQLKNDLITTLRNKGVEVSDDEKLNTLVPKVNEVEGESGFEIVDMPIDGFAGTSSYPGVGKMLKSFKIPDGSTIIPNYAFYECNYLESVKIPEGVTRIDTWAFAYCRKLFECKIPNSITYIGGAAFYCCNALSENIVIPNGSSIIEGSTFYACGRLPSIVIPNTVIRIDNYAFYSCRNLANIYYTGTEEQWNAIIKGIGWDDNMGINVSGGTVIHYNYIPE